MKAHPDGQDVKFSVLVKMNRPSLRVFLEPIGRATMVATMRIKFMNTNMVCNFPMILDMTEARTPWQRTQARKVP